MRFTSIALALASAAGVSAQTQHQILVGANGTLTYSPPNITAAIGDLVTFVFQSKNHTVTQSLFASPCEQFTNTSISDPTKQNLTSGFMPVPANASSFPTWTIQVTQLTPIWFFCEQTGHCAKGMVGAINANETSANTFEAFQAKAEGTATTGTSTTASGTPSGTSTSTASAKASSGAATANKVSLQMSGSVGVALFGVALGMML